MSDTQLICATKPFCLCVGQVNEWDECCCFTGLDGLCISCGAKMILINFETGEPVVITTPEPNEIAELDINTGSQLRDELQRVSGV